MYISNVTKAFVFFYLFSLSSNGMENSNGRPNNEERRNLFNSSSPDAPERPSKSTVDNYFKELQEEKKKEDIRKREWLYEYLQKHPEARKHIK